MALNAYDGIVDINSVEYPQLLKETADAPLRLYFRGKWNPELFDYCLAVVGTRKISRYGRCCTQSLVEDISRAGVTIVSGFMYGVDAAAHKAALDAGGKTIAVMPCGIDYITPHYQTELYQRILDNDGLIISEYEPGRKTCNGYFVARNRIVAGLSQATLVVEGAKKSGTMITAGLTIDYDRYLFAVPGPINALYSQGPNYLIQQGAYLASSSRAILQMYDLSMNEYKTNKKKIELPKEEQLIMGELHKEALEIDELSRRLAMFPAQLAAFISILQIKGLIEEENGRFYVSQSKICA